MMTRYYDFTGNWNEDHITMASATYNEDEPMSSRTSNSDCAYMVSVMVCEETPDGYFVSQFPTVATDTLLRNICNAFCDHAIEVSNERGWSSDYESLKDALDDWRTDPQAVNLLEVMNARIKAGKQLDLNARKERSVELRPYSHNAADNVYSVLFWGAEHNQENGLREIPSASYQLLVSGLEMVKSECSYGEELNTIREAIGILEMLRDRQKRREWARAIR